MKECRICKEIKELSEFHKKKDTKDGYRNECKNCIKEIQKEYYKDSKNIERRKIYDKKRYEEKKEEILARKKIYHQKNKEKINFKKRNNEYQKKVYQKYKNKNPHIIVWRSILYSTLKRLGTKKQGHTNTLLGYSAIELKQHIEKQFTIGMTWNNHGEWHIDHKIPVSHFTSETTVNIVCSLDNLQPLWSTTREINGIVYEGNLNKSKRK